MGDASPSASQRLPDPAKPDPYNTSGLLQLRGGRQRRERGRRQLEPVGPAVGAAGILRKGPSELRQQLGDPPGAVRARRLERGHAAASGQVDGRRRRGRRAAGITSANPYYWADTAGNQYITVYDSPKYQAGDSGAPYYTANPALDGLPVNPTIATVLKYTPGSNQVTVFNGNSPNVQPVLLHRGETTLTLPTTRPWGRTPRSLPTLADLRPRATPRAADRNDAGGPSRTWAPGRSPLTGRCRRRCPRSR